MHMQRPSVLRLLARHNPKNPEIERDVAYKLPSPIDAFITLSRDRAWMVRSVDTEACRS